MSRSAVVVALGTAVVAAILVFTLTTGGRDRLPGPWPDNDGAATQAGAPEAVRDDDPGEGPAPSREPLPRIDAEPAAPPPVAPPAPASRPPGHGTVLLEVLDDREGTSLPRFSWSLVDAVPDMPDSGEGTAGSAWLRVPLATPAAIRVHAPGHESSLAVDVSLPAGARHRTVTLRLLPVVTGPLVILDVRDDQQRPVQHLRIRCEVQPQGPEGRNRWDLLWQRVSSAVDGAHGLSDLEPARHRFRLLALDDHGRPRLLLPVTQPLRVDGHVQQRQSITMQAAGSILLSVVDAKGAALGSELSVQLADHGGRRLPVRWRTVAPTAFAPTADTLPDAAPCELDEPVPPGTYQLVVSGPGIEFRRELWVDAGARAKVEAVVRRPLPR